VSTTGLLFVLADLYNTAIVECSELWSKRGLRKRQVCAVMLIIYKYLDVGKVIIAASRYLSIT
jgi:hypothetical protein